MKNANHWQGITALLHNCLRLTHLSLTGVQAFLHDDITRYCRDAPAEFTHPQRDVFCVFSGEGVHRLRSYLLHRAAVEASRQEQDPEMEGLFEGNESPGADTMSDDDVTVDGNEPAPGQLPPLAHPNIPIVSAPRYPRPRPHSLHSFPPQTHMDFHQGHVEPPLYGSDQMVRLGPWTPNAPLTPEMRASLAPAHLHLISSTTNYYPLDPELDHRSRSPGPDLGAPYDHRARSSSRGGSRRHTLETSSFAYDPAVQTLPYSYADGSLRRDTSRLFVDDDRREFSPNINMPMPYIPGRHHGNFHHYPGPSRPRDLPLPMTLRPASDYSVHDENIESIMSTLPLSRRGSRNPSRSNSPHISRVSSRSRMFGYLPTSSPAQYSSPASGSVRPRPRMFEDESAMPRAMVIDSEEQSRTTRIPPQEARDMQFAPPFVMEHLPVTPVTPMSPSRTPAPPDPQPPQQNLDGDVHMT